MNKAAYKLNVALLFGYNGEKFHGLQKMIQEGINTVEGELERALYKTGLITE